MKKYITTFLLLFFYTSNIFATEIIPNWCTTTISDGNTNTYIQTYSSFDGKTTIRIDRSQYRHDNIVKVNFQWKTTTYADVLTPIFFNDWKDVAFLAYKNTEPYETIFVKNGIETLITWNIIYDANNSALYYSDGKNMVYGIEEKDGNKSLYKNDKALSININKYRYIKNLTLSSNGESVAFITMALDDKEYREFPVKDGVEDRRFSNATNLILSPDGKRMIYNAYDKSVPRYITVVNWKVMKQSSLVCGNEKIYFSQNSKSYICEWMDRKTEKVAIIKDGTDLSKWKYWDIRNVEYLSGTTSYTFFALTYVGKDIKPALIKDWKVIPMKYEEMSNVQQLNDNKNIAYIANKTIAKNNQQWVVVIKWKELVSLPRPNLLNYPWYIITGLTITNKNTGKDFIIEFKKEISSNQYKNWTMVCKDIK